MKALLVDDEKLQLIGLRKAVEETLPHNAEIFSFSNPMKAWEGSKGKHIDLAFLDVEMPGMSGIDLAEKLQGDNPSINIIFVTAYDKYALSAYQIHASGYLTKPVTKEKIEKELWNLRNPIKDLSKKKVQAKCFGNFEVFYDGVPIKFMYNRSKEVFAYLIDREGAAVNINELNAVLWEEDHKSYLRNLIADIQSTLKAIGASDVFVKRQGECFVNVDEIDCDAYEYRKGDPDAIQAYRGEYMIQYPWAIFDY